MACLGSRIFGVGDRAQALPVPLGRHGGEEVRELEEMRSRPRGLGAGPGETQSRGGVVGENQGD